MHLDDMHLGDLRLDHLWDTETARTYDTPGTGMFAPELLDPTVDRLAELAAGGRALAGDRRRPRGPPAR
jgi:hypothetical protein